jgi:hypothetical protein
MSRTDIFTKFAIYLLGVLATIGFFITKNENALNWATTQEYKYGDLYRFAKVARFKPSVPLSAGPDSDRDSIDKGQEQPTNTEALFFGDSFGFRDAGEGTLVDQLERRIGTPMFSVYRNNHPSLVQNPYLLLNSEAPSRTNGRMLVYEIVERLIQNQFDTGIPTNAVQTTEPKSFIDRAWSKIEKTMFENSEARSEALLKHGRMSAPIVAWWNTAVFDVLEQISPETPLYSLHPPFLFFRDEVINFQTPHTDEHIARLADNVAAFGRDLRERFGLTLYFIPVPNKITVYSQLATNQPYDGFLPRLCADLKSRGVDTVEMLPAFQHRTNLLYWPSDTHWNAVGIRIGVEKSVENWPRTSPE